MDHKEKTLTIDNKKITDDTIFVIAEIGVNHNGDMKKAFKLIDIAKEIGADPPEGSVESQGNEDPML